VSFVRRTSESYPWVFALVGTVAIISITTAVSGRSPVANLDAAFQSGAILAIVAIGQMFVITAGSGNIDLSIPGVMTLGGFVGIGAASSSHDVALGVGAALCVGVVAAAVNICIIMVVGVPPIVATLATNLIADSAVLVLAANFNGSPPAALQGFVDGSVGGIPAVAFVAVAIAAVGAVGLHRTRFGRGLSATGQSPGAASRAGISVRRTTMAAYIVSGLCAGLAGLLLSAVTGASIGIGDPYLLISVAAVVVGGSSIRGGRSNVGGVLIAAVFLNVILTLFYTLRLTVGYQDVLEGVIIIVVLAGLVPEKVSS